MRLRNSAAINFITGSDTAPFHGLLPLTLR